MTIDNFFAELKATQRLQGCGGLGGSQLVIHPGSYTGLSLLRDSKLGGAGCRAATYLWFSGRADSVLGLPRPFLTSRVPCK